MRRNTIVLITLVLLLNLVFVSSASAAPASSGTSVIFYQDANYGGVASGGKAAGDYASLPGDVPNDWMSSLKVPSGWSVDAYADGNFGGAVCSYTADTSWVGSACNDVMSSFKIHAPVSGWTSCASENGTCSFSGTQQVRYGSGSFYSTRTATGSIACNNATFGDPNFGVAKSCDYRSTVGSGSFSTAGWTQCASENGTCSASGQVVYGGNGWFSQRNSGGSIACNNSTFGDPVPGTVKACYYQASSFWGDTTSIPAATNVLMLKFLNRTNGKYPDSQIYWSFNGQTHSIADQPYFDMPANSAGRMYFYLGSPTSQYTDFIEFTVGPGQFNGNTTRVDWFGIKLAMRLHASDGYDAAVGEDLTTFQEDRAVTFQKFVNEVPAEFKHLAQNWAPYRISAPGKMGDVDFTPSGIYANYYTAYAQSVGVNASVFDIMACAGTLANNAAMCSALNRHVAHLAQSQWTTSSLFYQAAPANYYARFWHNHSLGALAYGFPYDDYGNYSSFVSHSNPQWLLVAIGW